MQRLMEYEVYHTLPDREEYYCTWTKCGKARVDSYSTPGGGGLGVSPRGALVFPSPVARGWVSLCFWSGDGPLRIVRNTKRFGLGFPCSSHLTACFAPSLARGAGWRDRKSAGIGQALEMWAIGQRLPARSEQF